MLNLAVSPISFFKLSNNFRIDFEYFVGVFILILTNSSPFLFSVKHEKLGEDIASAVVLKEGLTVYEKELKAHLSKSIATFKIPRQILILNEIPKCNTGKIQRIGLAKKLGLER